MKVAPPLLLVAMVALQVALSILLPRPRLVPAPLSAIGLVPAVLGVLLHLRAGRTFRRSETTLDTLARPRRLVTRGSYARSRNPMYLGGALFLVGLGVLLGPLVTLVVPPLYLAVAARWWIAPEEELLERSFGAEYLRYRDTVRRWI